MNPKTLAVRLLALLIFFACAAASADALDRIIDRGSLRIGVAEFVPWTMKDADGELIGFEIDLGHKLAADMGVTADIRLYDWEEVIAALEKREIDVIAGGMAITPKRALRVNFSRPVARSGVGIATNTRMTSDMQTLEELNHPDIVIATAADTMSAEVSQTLFDEANVIVFGNGNEAAAAVLDGEAHAYLASMPEIMFLSLRNPDVVDVPIDEPLFASAEALAVRKGEQELLTFLDAWVTARQADKWIQSTRDYWFGTLDWAEQLAQ